MKNITLIVALAIANFSHSQYTTAWPPTTTVNTSAAGYVGIGTKTTSTSSVLPAYNLHLHGTSDYTIYVPAGPATLEGPGTPAYYSPQGKTTRLGLTNALTGMTESDGTVLRASGNDFIIENQETSGNLTLKANGVDMRFSGTSQRISVGTAGTTASYAKFNVGTTDNGIMIQSLTSTSGYGLRVKMASATKNAIEVFNGSGTTSDGTRNFSVNGAGNVFARKYTTTLANIPDYVFQPEYKLMPLAELRTYVNTNSHLPNVPSAKEFETTGVDLGELNRLLLEKTEELTLYIFQLEERLRILEENK